MFQNKAVLLKQAPHLESKHQNDIFHRSRQFFLVIPLYLKDWHFLVFFYQLLISYDFVQQEIAGWLLLLLLSLSSFYPW